MCISVGLSVRHLVIWKNISVLLLCNVDASITQPTLPPISRYIKNMI